MVPVSVVFACMDMSTYHHVLSEWLLRTKLWAAVVLYPLRKISGTKKARACI